MPTNTHVNIFTLNIKQKSQDNLRKERKAQSRSKMCITTNFVVENKGIK